MLFGLASPSPVEAKAVLPRAGRLFATYVGVLVAVGTALAIPCLGSWGAFVGTSYGLLVAATLASTPPGADVGKEVATAGEVGHVFAQGWRDIAQHERDAFDIDLVGVSIFSF